jgi:Zn-dependent protease/CBS domain-containing protein
MKWSFRIARVAGIDVRIHLTFLLLLAFWGWSGYVAGGWLAAGLSVLFISLLFFCVVLHEFGHAMAARMYGIRTPDITLLPIGGVARLERIPENPVQELVIAIAGPMVNVVIALGLWLALGMPTHVADLMIFDGHVRSLAQNLMEVNVFLVAFNLIPAFPMDGGRMLRAGLAFWLDHAKATRVAARVGQGIAVVFAFVGLFGIPGVSQSSNPFLLLIAMFVFMGAQQEAAYATMRAAVEGVRVADAMITRFQAMPHDLPIATAAEEALHDTQPIYPVTDPDLRVVGMVLRNELLEAASRESRNARVDTLARVVPTVPVDADFDEAFRLMQESGIGVLPVVNPSGQILGLVSFNHLRERASLRRV